MTPKINTHNTNRDLHFKGQYADEVVYAFFRLHWVTLLPHIFIHCVFLAGFTALFLNFSDVILPFFTTALGEFVLIVSVLMGSYFIHNFFIKFVNHFIRIVIITNLRIVETQNIIFMKDLQSSLDMNMIQDVEKKQNGFLKNILNFGELIIIMSSADMRTIRFAPNPNFHFRLVNRLKLESKQNIGKDNQRQHQPILFENFTFSGSKEANPKT